MLDNIREGFVLLDKDFKVLEMNKEGERIEGRPASQIVGKSIWESWPDLEDSDLGKLWRKAVDEQTSVELDHLYVTPDGRDVWLEMRAYPSRGGLAIFFRDVSEKRRAEIALQQTKTRLDAVLDNASVAIFLMDELHHCSYMNAAAERLTGFTFHETTGRPLHDVIHHKRPDGSHFPMDECAIDRAFPENNKQQGEEVFVHKDGSFYPVAYMASPIRDESSRIVGTIIEVRDISGEREGQAELRRTQSEVLHLSRVNAMDTMASTLAHELNQPLTAVANYIRGCRRLLANGGDPAQVADALLLAETSAQRAGEIVRRVRAFVSRGAVNASAQDLPDLVRHACVLALLDQQVRGVTHEYDFAADAHWVMADPIQVQQVVINLVRNAVEAMESCPRRHLVLATRSAGDLIEVSITDTGPGMSEEVREALFSPFQSTKSEGVGIGLSICRTIVEAHRGTIRAEEAEGGGTVFRFTLPKADDPRPLKGRGR